MWCILNAENILLNNIRKTMDKKYTEYNEFVIAVIKKAAGKCQYEAIQKLFRYVSNLLDIIYAILGVGWVAFLAVCALLVLAPIAFAIALVAFVGAGIGLVIVGVLAIWGGAAAIKVLYKYKFVPLSIKEIGEKYKDDFDAHKGDITYIDKLIEKAADELIDSWVDKVRTFDWKKLTK